MKVIKDLTSHPVVVKFENLIGGDLFTKASGGGGVIYMKDDDGGYLDLSGGDAGYRSPAGTGLLCIRVYYGLKEVDKND